MAVSADILKLFAPAADLRRFVKVIYIIDSPWLGIDQYIPAWTKPYVVFQYADPVFSTINGNADRVADISVSGLVSRRYRFTTPARQIKLCIVEFTPVGMYCLLREHASEFTDTSVDANVVIPARKRAQVCEALDEIADETRKVEVIQAFLRQLLPESVPREALMAERALAVMERGRYNVSVTQLASEVALGERHFRRLFTRVTGLAPKAYQRVERFRETFHALSEQQSWTRIPEFHDQAHLIHDFSSFTGYAPTKLPAEQFFFFRELTRPGFGSVV